MIMGVGGLRVQGLGQVDLDKDKVKVKVPYGTVPRNPPHMTYCILRPHSTDISTFWAPSIYIQVPVRVQALGCGLRVTGFRDPVGATGCDLDTRAI